MRLFEYLKVGLADRHWSIPRFARECGVSGQLAYKWLAEDEAARIIPGPASCEKIAEALGIDPDYVLELAGHRKVRADQPTTLNPRLSAFLATVEAGWLAMDESKREVAERGTRALFATDPLPSEASNRRRTGASTRHLAPPRALDSRPELTPESEDHGGLSTVQPHPLDVLLNFANACKRLIRPSIAAPVLVLMR